MHVCLHFAAFEVTGFTGSCRVMFFHTQFFVLFRESVKKESSVTIKTLNY